VLREQWKFDGLVVSDWNSVMEMIAHGYSADAAQAASQSVNAGLDMEMVSTSFRDHLPELVEQGVVSEAAIDTAVRRILRVKLALKTPAEAKPAGHALMSPRSLELARKLARESLVLLKNDEHTLPLKRESLEHIAVIGPLADAAQSQLGCWTLDGVADDAITPLEALRNALGDAAEISYAAGAGQDLSGDASGIDEAVELAEDADAVLLFVGEDATLSGEARSRSEIGLPGAQAELVRRVAEVGKPVVMVVLAGRQLTIGDECELVDAVLYAWHPGTMGGLAIVDILMGVAPPSGKLPVTFPKSVGQIPLYYAHSNTGRPSPPDFRPWIETGGPDLPEEFRYRSNYVDSDPFPLFPFGFGLSYTTFAYGDLELGTKELRPGQVQAVRARVTNTGDCAGVETVQLYVRDQVASTVRPVRELKAFRRVWLKAGQSKVVEFALPTGDLAYVDPLGKRTLEPGRFTVWVGGDSMADLSADFALVPNSRDADRNAPAGDEASLNFR
jgi:beta-glucosidase